MSWKRIDLLTPSCSSSDSMPDGTLANIPEDVLIPILSGACHTDGGQTGCALSLVSRAVRAFCLETGVDITSASVCGEEKLKRFLVMLRRRQPESRRVLSLFLFPTVNPSSNVKIHPRTLETSSEFS